MAVSKSPRGGNAGKPAKKRQTAPFDVVVYFPVILGLIVLLIGSVYDPKKAYEQYFPPPLDLSSRAFRMITSPLVIVLWSCIAYGIKLEREATVKYNLDRRERFALIWSLCNACWFHTGADVLSGLFQIMPNMSETYLILNKDHKLPMHHPERVVMDCIYWLELLLETPLALLVFYMFYTRHPSRYVIESYLHGLHFGGYVGYYVPDMVLMEYTHIVISNLDRTIALAWVIIPHYLVYDCYKREAAKKTQ